MNSSTCANFSAMRRIAALVIGLAPQRDEGAKSQKPMDLERKYVSGGYAGHCLFGNHYGVRAGLQRL